VLGILIVGCAVLGLLIGSFLNVVIARVPEGRSIVSPPSACPACHAPISPRDNIPVLSWLVLRGRCRHCHAPISAQYPLVEVACAALFAGTAARFGYEWVVPAFLALFAGLLALSVIDVQTLRLPKAVVYVDSIIVAALLLLATAITHTWHQFGVGVICAAVWFVLFFGLNFASPRMLGFGDVRLAPVLGLALGWLGVGYVVLGFLAANLIGAVIGVVLIASKRMSRNEQIPYGVFLAAGCAVAVFAGPWLLRPFHH